MNLIFRMLWVLLLSRRRPMIELEDMVSRLSLRTLPNDLDLNMHMNNGRYLTICDLSRVDFFIRSGLANTMIKKKWMPIIAEHTMTYRRPLKVFQKFDLEMDISHWDDKFFHCRHRFIVEGKVVAEGTSKGLFKGKEGIITPKQVFTTLAGIRDIPIPEGFLEGNYRPLADG